MDSELVIIFENSNVKVLLPEKNTHDGIDYYGVRFRIYYSKKSPAYILSLLNENGDDIHMVCDYYDILDFDYLTYEFTKLIDIYKYLNPWCSRYLMKTIKNYPIGVHLY